MSLRADDRAAAIQIGAVVLFAFLILAVAGWQATVVPQENAEIEYAHSQRAQDDMQDVRNSIVSAPGGGASPSIAVDMAPQYPTRAIFVNPGPPSGTLRTVGTSSDAVNLTVDNATVADDEVDDYWNGDAKSFSTGALVYEPNYNVYTSAPMTVYENSIVYNRGRGVNITRAGQSLVDGRRISLVALNGSLGTTRSGTYSVDVQQLSASSTTVALQNDGTDDLTITFASRRNASQWRTLLEESGEFDPDDSDPDAYVKAVRQEPVTVDGVQFFAVTLVLEQGTTYELRMAKVGIGAGTKRAPEAYGVDVEGDGASISVSGSQRVTVEVRDRFNNPVGGATVTNTSASDLNGGSLDAESLTTGADGRATFEFEAGNTGTATLQFNVSQDATVTGAELVNVTIAVVGTGGGGGGGGGAYAAYWKNPPAPTGGAFTCDGTGDDCTLDASQSSSVTLTMKTDPIADGAQVDFAVNNTTVGTLSTNNATTGSNGEASTTFNADENGQVKVYTSSGGSGDTLNITVTGLGGGGNSPPEIGLFQVTAGKCSGGGGGGNAYCADWDASDVDGNIVDATVYLENPSNGTIDSQTYTYGGVGSIAEQTTLQYGGNENPDHVRIVVNDAAGASDEELEPV